MTKARSMWSCRCVSDPGPRLAVTGLLLSHFRSHKTARLELDGRPVALFGPNGAGKTNILEAVSLLSPGRGLRRAASDEFIRRPEALGWKVRAQLHSLHQIHEIETFAEPGQPRSIRIDGKAATQPALGRVVRMLWLVPAMDRLWLESAEGRRRFLDRMVLSLEPGHADAALAYEKAMRQRNRLLKDQVRDSGWYDALELQMSETGARIHAARLRTIARIADAQAAAGDKSAFPSAALALSHPDEPLPGNAEALRERLGQARARDLAAGRTLIGPHRADLEALYVAKDVPARQCSTGEQKALLISLVLANARALRTEFGAPPVLLLDEVAAHLDAGRRAALYDEIIALRAQAWMTGTGSELFADLGARAQMLALGEEGGLSHIAPQ